MSELRIFGSQPIKTAWGEVAPPEPLLRCSVTWKTLVTESHRSGIETRTAKLTEPRFSIEGTDFILNAEAYATLAQAFLNADGQAISFPFKCPLDYYCTATPEVFDSGVTQQGILVDIGNGNYQIVKKYTVGGISSYKTIIHPVAGTISVYANGTLQTSGVTVDTGTGIVTFASPPSGTLTVSCEFRLPFRFNVSDLQLTQIKRAIEDYDASLYQSVNFSLIEDDYDKKSPLESADWDSTITYNFANGALPRNTTYSDKTATRIESADNLKEERESTDNQRQIISLANSNQNWIELQRCYTLFNVAKGQLLPLGFGSKKVRFVKDEFVSEQVGESVWTFEDIGLTQVIPPPPPDPPPPGPSLIEVREFNGSWSPAFGLSANSAATITFQESGLASHFAGGGYVIMYLLEVDSSSNIDPIVFTVYGQSFSTVNKNWTGSISNQQTSDSLTIQGISPVTISPPLTIFFRRKVELWMPPS